MLLVEVKGECMPDAHRIDLPQRTLDLLILQALALEPQHGWAWVKLTAAMAQAPATAQEIPAC